MHVIRDCLARIIIQVARPPPPHHFAAAPLQPSTSLPTFTAGFLLDITAAFSLISPEFLTGRCLLNCHKPCATCAALQPASTTRTFGRNPQHHRQDESTRLPVDARARELCGWSGQRSHWLHNSKRSRARSGGSFGGADERDACKACSIARSGSSLGLRCHRKEGGGERRRGGSVSGS
jgi:hypothetical protein